MSKPVYIGDQPLKGSDQEPAGEFVQIDGERYYKLTGVDKMRPFFMSIVSSDNHWMFVSSNKGMTSGRRNSDQALFPYYTDDKLVQSSEFSGSKSIFLVHVENRTQLWEPYSNRFAGVYDIQRNLYKNKVGSKVIFEEINSTLGMTFQESWSFSNKFGIVKSTVLTNNSENLITVQLIDGIQNILPAGLSEMLQSIRSNLADAYKKIELVDDLIGIYSLSARIVDRAIPSESLSATTVWATGIKPDKILLSSQQLDAFRTGKKISAETDIRAEKGAYFILSTIELEAGLSQSWKIIADVEQPISDLVELRTNIKVASNMPAEIDKDVRANSKELLENIASSDGLQISHDELQTTRHLNNVLFNIMRGGVFQDDYEIETNDFLRVIERANRLVFEKNNNFLSSLPDSCSIEELKNLVATTNDPDLIRLSIEYLPLSFSRRHGDPSRPWNKFNIITKDRYGKGIKYYEGNWRDIFQNWEALALSYPAYLENMILKFLNASTIDGYNPYRISSNGIDWEIVEPDDPWSYIGYWGDHQLIYLLKLLELYQQYYPGDLHELLSKNIGVFANVPYKIKSFKDILENPQDTIEFDDDLAASIDLNVEKLGSDGKLIPASGSMLRASVIEKILISVLTKISNFIPDAGIWMNTQRPEWNDANNALVGNGVSMVTLYQLRRYLKFISGVLSSGEVVKYKINGAVLGFIDEINKVFTENSHVCERKSSGKERMSLMTALGEIGENYRSNAYNSFDGFSTKELSSNDLTSCFTKVLSALDQTILLNKRDDGLYHSYNIISYDKKEASIDRLDPMLEGQVNILSSGYLTASESLALLKALEKSSLYRKDQDSYLLYPDKELAKFVDRNNISQELINKSDLVKKLREADNIDVIRFDIDGHAHFNATIHNAEELNNVLDQLAQVDEYAGMVEKDREMLNQAHEAVFNHKEFTGRSGTFYGYEGLGSIYWHMVSKLVQSVGEIVAENKGGGDAATLGELEDCFHRLKAGIGVHKSPVSYGAIPTDPYSHTPGNKGVQQPGMTGQVKEDILSRFTELGVEAVDGQIVFNGGYFSEEEFLLDHEIFQYLSINGEWEELELNAGSLGFTYCQVPIVYEKSNTEEIIITYIDNTTENVSGRIIPIKLSDSIFGRRGNIKSIKVLLGNN